MIDKLKGGSNPFKKSGTQYAKDQKAIKKLNKDYSLKAKTKKKKKVVKPKASTYKKGKLLDSFFVPTKKPRLVSDINPKYIFDSFGESVISDWLRKHQIKFIREKKFADLISPKTNQHLRFDFYLPDSKMCIEFDGIQHFQYCEDFDKGDKSLLSKRKFNDSYKNGYCEYKKIKILRISYKEISQIDKILCRELI